MGADIHFVIEENMGEHGWVGIYDTDSPFAYKISGSFAFKNREYNFFARLAGVRGDGPEPNGLPEDASALTVARATQWGSDGHSHGHRSLEGFLQIYLEATGRITDYAAAKLKGEETSFLSGLAHIERSDKDLSEFRVCYWFDN